MEVQVDQDATSKLRNEKPMGKFNGLGTYIDRNHLAISELEEAWSQKTSFKNFISTLLNLPFYKALLFTLTFCFTVTPFVIVLGFCVALSLNVLSKSI